MAENEKSFPSLSRRSFFAVGGGVLGSLTAATGCGKKEPSSAPPSTEPAAQAPEFPQDVPYCGFRMGVQSYCFREYETTGQVIEALKTLGLAHVEIWPGGHMPLDMPLEERQARIATYRDAGITIDACGVLGLKNDEAECRRIFEYAKDLGVLCITAGPQYDALPLLDDLTAEFGIPIAIHNHGPGDKLWGTPEKIRTHLEGTSTRIGLCIDLGHFHRVQADPMTVIDEFADRLHGIHLKDMVPGEDGKYEDAIVGRGNINMPEFLAKLKAIGFKGSFSLEYESDPANPIPAMQECLLEVRKGCKEIG
ncbi:MAG: sugar phosphate isomerase/epimerase [Gemmatimonadota bacterium]|nr:sugar phosphate isomerase/epimerase [Gemmatimonadota bacterium]